MSNFTGPGSDDPNQGQRPPQPPYQPAAPGPSAPLSQADDHQWASLAHLGGILMFVPALVLYLVFKDRGPLTSVEAKEALNFQITLLIGYVGISIVSTIIGFLTFGIGSVLGGLGWVLYIVGVVFSVLGYLQAKDGNHYRYPFALRLVS
ncbi:DUF4870 domain-containing protein [Cryobacterium cryoconiti]|uniref:DUF4870 domain-containing protein n=1 Tax=Cryobacterium cryoconiti TaxID=1259239 RepID=A0A4Y8JYM9_9MICO|nr:DUF4870 domain-containing protein [Cryobacterium cryoconiti]TFD33176.1 DUF4870 domain-containing protein [Cryobacterium cryoconiti]